MPLPHEHSARLAQPGRFKPRTFRSKRIAPGIRIIIAKRKPRGTSMETQAVRFDVCRYTAAQARAWLRRHDMKPIRFEKATGRCERR